jgi:hypothetical protein
MRLAALHPLAYREGNEEAPRERGEAARRPRATSGGPAERWLSAVITGRARSARARDPVTPKSEIDE